MHPLLSVVIRLTFLLRKIGISFSSIAPEIPKHVDTELSGQHVGSLTEVTGILFSLLHECEGRMVSCYLV